LGSLEEDFLYALMGQSHLMLYPYITLFLSMLSFLAPLVLAASPEIEGTLIPKCH
jgi:hypothetical protein